LADGLVVLRRSCRYTDESTDERKPVAGHNAIAIDCHRPWERQCGAALAITEKLPTADAKLVPVSQSIAQDRRTGSDDIPSILIANRTTRSPFLVNSVPENGRPVQEE